MTDDEQRLRYLLDRAAPDLGGIDPVTVRARGRRRSGRPQLNRYAARAAAVVVVAGVALAVPLSRNANTSSHPAAAPSGHTSATGEDSYLANLTKNVPCPMAVSTGEKSPTSRTELEHFHAVAALRCNYMQKSFPDDGDWTVTIREATSTGIGALVHAFDQPDQPSDMPTGGFVECAGVGVIWPPLLLVDSEGNYLIPPRPVTTGLCGGTLRSVTKAVNGLTWQTISEQKTSQQTSASGCTVRVGNVPYNNAHDNAWVPRRAAGEPVFGAWPPVDLKVCLYRTSASALSVGTYVRSAQLDETDSAALLAALDGPGRPAADGAKCPGQRDFATVTAQHGVVAYVELGGCWRLEVHDGSTSVGTASSPAIVKALLQTE